MSVRYQEVQWSEEPVSTRKLQTMVDNTENLRLSRPETVIKTAGGAFSKNQGVKILFGSAIVTPSGRNFYYQKIYFGNYFSVGCKPIIQASVNTYHKKRVSVSFSSLKATTVPDHEGFNAYVWGDADSGGSSALTKTLYITYSAGGW